MTDENLIEEAAKAAYEGAFLKHAPEEVDRWEDLLADNHPAVESWRDVARLVLAVFEKAHAPTVAEGTTDDEWEAMLESIEAGKAYYAREDIPEDGLSEAEQIADFLTDAGFRRAPEPEVEYEYGLRTPGGRVYVPVLHEDVLAESTPVRRRKAGPWEPVEPTGKEGSA